MQELFSAFVVEHGLPALFGLSFLASTLLPVGSEPLLVLMLIEGRDPYVCVGVATAGNTLGSVTSYLVGLWGGPVLIHRILRVSEASLDRARRVYRRFGAYSLLLSWLPILGDPLCVLGGIFRLKFPLFVGLVSLSKLLRYAFVAYGFIVANRIAGS